MQALSDGNFMWLVMNFKCRWQRWNEADFRNCSRKIAIDGLVVNGARSKRKWANLHVDLDFDDCAMAQYNECMQTISALN